MERILPAVCDNLYLRKLLQGAQTDLSKPPREFVRGGFLQHLSEGGMQ